MSYARESISGDHGLGVAAALAYLVAVVHLFHPTHGFARLILVLTADPGLLLADPRPFAFVVSAAAILLAVPAVIRGYPERRAFALGAGLMLVYLVGYFTWHLSGHGGFLPGREALYHGYTPIEAVTIHLTTDHWAAASVLLESALLVVLVGLLYRRE
ncbi:MAG TPA: hypothetical protein VKA37_10785 [Halobacteriales archaeon]|nr:hypothetical protein [Halobacteriales archaeon]